MWKAFLNLLLAYLPACLEIDMIDMSVILQWEWTQMINMIINFQFILVQY